MEVIFNGTRLSEEDIYNQLRRITQFAEEAVSGDNDLGVQPRVGALTALPRNEWAEVWERMAKDIVKKVGKEYSFATFVLFIMLSGYCNCFSADPQNQANLKAITKSMFVLCLDQPIGPVRELDEEANLNGSIDDLAEAPAEYRRDDVSLALQLLHGFGSKYNAANRWYDKTMQNTSVLRTKLLFVH
ncbi:hypothetical protein X801_10210 [Opisthorchis viverrini]|uniref:Choline/carnitine acyltransferase domain-containing protein n=1 Tax=Opisthorchis viverrini TaxID=6198 RepID=A0A1S8WHR8_OPIVI|nr:hypothetical protein X801_10210 [Opisthorchis viverrini]